MTYNEGEMPGDDDGELGFEIVGRLEDIRSKKEGIPEDNDEEEDNPMAMKLKKMRLELRNQQMGASLKERSVDANEDFQGYDAYKSPMAK